MKNKIKNWLKANTSELLLANDQTIIKMVKENDFIVIYYKDNDMADFCYGLEINAENLKSSVIISIIAAFIAA